MYVCMCVCVCVCYRRVVMRVKTIKPLKKKILEIINKETLRRVKTPIECASNEHEFRACTVMRQYKERTMKGCW